MRKLLIAVGVIAILVILGVVGLRRVPAGYACWQRGSGTYLVAGESSVWIARWGWSQLTDVPVNVEFGAASRDGARVGVEATVTFPAGRHVLSAAATAAEAVRSALAPTVRSEIATFEVTCLVGLGLGQCPDDPSAAMARTAAAALKLPESALTIRLVPDPASLALARHHALRELVGRPPRRVLVIGWDGADWEVLEALVQRGMMPNLGRLMAKGSWGKLASIAPLLSPLIWTTMATGVAPEEHGVLDFVEVDAASGNKVPVSGRQRRVPALWNLASATGLSAIVSGWWATWPAEPVNGVLISDRLFFLLSDTVGDAPAGTVVFPAEREPQYRALAQRAEMETDEGVVRSLFPVSSEAFRRAAAAHRGMSDPVDGFRRIMVGTRTYFGAAEMAAAQIPKADLVMVYSIGTDEIGHVLAPYLPPALPGADVAFSEAAATGVARYFSVVDRWLGRMLAGCPESECAVLIVSDHGFKWGSDRPREFSGTAAATAALWHRPQGIFVLAGKDVRALGRVAEAPSVYDVAPTIAALLGLPAGKSWRGKPLPGCPATPRAAVNWAALVPPESYRPAAAGAQPSPEYVNQLKSLGYLEGAEGLGKGEASTEGELNNLGLLHLEAGRFAEAEKAFRNSIARNERYASPHYNLRRLYFETGRFDEADAELWRAVDLGLRDAVGAVDRAATDYDGKGNPARAALLLGEGTRHFPGEVRLAVHRLAILMRSNQCPDAVAAGRAAARRFATDATVHAFFGLAAACAGDTETARTALKRSLELNPNQPEIRQALDALPPGS
jgi:tetratricopeptide (TPR) repeat protein